MHSPNSINQHHSHQLHYLLSYKERHIFCPLHGRTKPTSHLPSKCPKNKHARTQSQLQAYTPKKCIYAVKGRKWLYVDTNKCCRRRTDRRVSVFCQTWIKYHNVIFINHTVGNNAIHKIQDYLFFLPQVQYKTIIKL